MNLEELQKRNSTLEKKIEEASSNLEKIQNIAQIGCWTLYINTHELIWSDETYKIFDIKKSKAQNLTFKDFFSTLNETNALIMTNEYNRHLEEKSVYSLILKITTRENNDKWIEQKCETSYDKEGKPIVSTGTIQDITEKRNKEFALKNQEKLLYQQSRLAQMGEMISMIAHQWRQPLAAISATSTGMNLKARRGKLDDEMILEKTKNITEYAQQLSSTIDDFREFFKPNKEKSNISYTSVIQSVLNIIETSFKNRNITLVKELECEQLTNTYPNELKQVILNLLKNAEDVILDKNIKNGCVKIKTYIQTYVYSDFNIDRSDKAMVLQISDNAGGIADEIISKIFDPYFSTKDDKNGTGLGLYMSKTIIEEHCFGTLQVSNEEGGACFRIILPILESNEEVHNG